MKRVFTAAFAVWLVAAAVLAAAGAVTLGVSKLKQSASALAVQDSARLWQADSDDRMSMVSAFFDPDAGVTKQDIYSLRESLDKKLEEASISNEVAGSRLYIDCWAARGDVRAETDRAGVTMDAFGVGGDFFFFHKLPLVDGWYMNDDESGRMTVVLDETAAWQLFGGSYVTGMTLKIDEIPYTVSGVVGTEEGSGYAEAYGDGPHMYLSYDVFSSLRSDDGAGAPVISYELVMPSPVSNFAYSFISEALGRSAPQAAYVENTGRYNAMPLYRILGSFFSRSLKTDRVMYPYWENSAAVTADICAALLLLQTLFFSAAGLIALVLLIVLIVRLKPKVAKIKDQAFDRIEEMTYKTAKPQFKK